MLPPVSEPREYAAILAATDDAEPPELPPATRLVSWGFFAPPIKEVSQVDPGELIHIAFTQKGGVLLL